MSDTDIRPMPDNFKPVIVTGDAMITGAFDGFELAYEPWAGDDVANADLMHKLKMSLWQASEMKRLGLAIPEAWQQTTNP